LTKFIDITYASLAKAFDRKLIYHDETLKRLREITEARKTFQGQTPEQRTAQERMALFPERAEVLFVSKDIWVVCLGTIIGLIDTLNDTFQPVVRLEGKLCIFPGIPSLFQKMLHALTPFLPLPPISERPFRHQIFTT
jgi:molybdopterin-biosynthesis enzyme MoeA-like protein